MGKTTICIRCGRHKIEIDGVLCRVCEYEKRKNQEKRQLTQNYKKYGIRETDSERALRIKSEKKEKAEQKKKEADACLLYTSPSPRDATLSRMPSSA